MGKNTLFGAHQRCPIRHRQIQRWRESAWSTTKLLPQSLPMSQSMEALRDLRLSSSSSNPSPRPSTSTTSPHRNTSRTQPSSHTSVTYNTGNIHPILIPQLSRSHAQEFGALAAGEVQDGYIESGHGC